MFNKGRRWLTCYHEAGHAVARWWLGHTSDIAVVLVLAEFLDASTRHLRDGERRPTDGFVAGYQLADPHLNRLALRIPGADTLDLTRRFDARVRMGLVQCYVSSFAEARYRRVSSAWCVFEHGIGDLMQARKLAEAWFADGDAA